MKNFIYLCTDNGNEDDNDNEDDNENHNDDEDS